jgi:hypothetical protein
MKITRPKLHSIVHGLMAEMGLLDRPATPSAITKICQVVLAEAEGHKTEPLAAKLMVAEDPDEESAKQSLFTVMRPQMLDNALREIPNSFGRVCDNGSKLEAIVCTTFDRQDQFRQVLTEFGVCPIRRKHPPRWAKRPGSCKLRLRVPLPKDWRLFPKP